MRAQQHEAGETGRNPGGIAARAPKATAPLPATEQADPRALMALQRTVGNAAATRMMNSRSTLPGGPPAHRGRRQAPSLPAVDESAEFGVVLPPYLMNLQAGGLSFTHGLTGHEFVHAEVTRIAGPAEETDRIRGELGGRPESFFGRGRSFVVKTKRGHFDVTVSVARDTDDEPGTFLSAGAPKEVSEARAASMDPAAREAESEGADIKVDSLRTSTGTGTSGTSRTSRQGLRGSGAVVAPVYPGLWAGAALAGDVNLTSATETHAAKAVSEPRTLRSDGGSVEVLRHVRYQVRITRGGSARGVAHTASGPGTLTMRVPREHLVPTGTTAPDHAAPLAPATAHEVALADSLAPLAVTDAGAPHGGGGGLFDAVASVLHPRLTDLGAPGRPHLYEATSAATVTEDLPRLLAGWVMGEDLASLDGTVKGAYRMRAEILSMAPAWSIGKTQLRTHQQAAHTVSDTSRKGGNLRLGAGPALAVGVPELGPVLRLSQVTLPGAGRSRTVRADQAASTRQGAEVRGEKVLYRTGIRLTAEGTGDAVATSGGRRARTATHDIDVMVSLRAEEARSLGLPLPEGTAAGDLVKTVDKDGRRLPARELPFGGMGSSVALGRFDSAPLIAAVERLFASSPRLAGYLPAEFSAPGPAGQRPGLAGGAGSAPADRRRSSATPSTEETEQQRTNYRNLIALLSQTNIRANKDQLLSTGIPVRLRRKTPGHAHDVQVLVTGRLGPVGHLGDTEDWLVRSSSGVGSGSQTGQSSSRDLATRFNFQLQLVPGKLSGGLSAESALHSGRSGQAGPAVRGDSLNSGQPERSSFGAELSLGVAVTMVTRERKAMRSLTPGRPGRHEPEVEEIASSAGAAEGDPLHLAAQDVRLTTPTGFTVGAAEGGRLRARTAELRRLPQPVGIAGIGALTGGALRVSGPQVRDWSFVETVGDGLAVRNLAYGLLSQAAVRNAPGRADNALATEGLAPRQAIEDRLSPQSVTAALRQAVGTGWVVDNLRHPRRLTPLTGAVGTRFALTRPRIVTVAKGPGTENMALGGHQAAGQKSRTTSHAISYGVAGREKGDHWQLGEGVAGSRGTHRRTAKGMSTTGTVERNSVVPRGRPLYLVQCDLLVRMVAEVSSGLGGTGVAASEQTIPGTVGLWLSEDQLAAAGLRVPGAEDGARPKDAAGTSSRAPGTERTADPAATTGRPERSGGDRQESEGAERTADPAATRDRPAYPGGDRRVSDGADRTADSAATTDRPAHPGGDRQASDGGDRQASDSADEAGPADPAAPPMPPALARDLPLGFGLIEDMPDLVPLLRELRGNVRDAGLAKALLPERQLDDPYRNVQRLLRVLDRDGAVGLLSGAMDGGVPVELFRNRVSRYRAVLRVERTGDAQPFEHTDGDRDMEFATVAVTDRGRTRERGTATGVSASLAGTGESEGGAVDSSAATSGSGVASTAATKSGETSRTQVGIRTIVDGSAPSVRMRVPVTASLELLSSDGRVAKAEITGRSLVYRALEKDMRALARVRPVAAPGAGRGLRRPTASPADLRTWRGRGAALPTEVQVNGFRGAEQLRTAIAGAVRDAGGSARFDPKALSHAAYAQSEAVSTEWLTAALPLLVSGGCDLPTNHHSGLEGQDLDCSLHARLRDGRVLGLGDTAIFETVAQSDPGEGRAGATDLHSGADHGRGVRGHFGAGPLLTDPGRMSEAVANGAQASDSSALAGNASGSVPLHKPKTESVLVQFTAEFRIVADIHNRLTQGVRPRGSNTATRDLVLGRPVVIRIPLPSVRRMLAGGEAAHVSDPLRLL
ncbi:hypothetical protein ACIO93_05255 [Streptomyces sp. NPDC087903]|uniref:hypothetical protein n=1 Tax=Streptomyces sp. NPDC087903 TaxID=3365819 RepID=UPI0038150D53